MPDVILARGASVHPQPSEAKSQDRPRRFFEPGRLARAQRLAVVPLGPRQYRVQGQQEPYYDVDLDGDPPCYCADSFYRGRRLQNKCKHFLASLLASRDLALVQALADDYLRRLENGSIPREDDE